MLIFARTVELLLLYYWIHKWAGGRIHGHNERQWHEEKVLNQGFCIILMYKRTKIAFVIHSNSCSYPVCAHAAL